MAPLMTVSAISIECTMSEFHQLWQVHQEAQWPESLGATEGQLMMVDTVIVGCITYFIEEEALDSQRVVILEDSLSELDSLLPDLPEEAVGYFARLQKLGSFLLHESTNHTA